MAAISAADLQEIRHSVVSQGFNPDWTKGQINAAAVALDTWFDAPATRSAVSALIDTATSPKVFTNNQKKAIFKAWLLQKFGAGV